MEIKAANSIIIYTSSRLKSPGQIRGPNIIMTTTYTEYLQINRTEEKQQEDQMESFVEEGLMYFIQKLNKILFILGT